MKSAIISALLLTTVTISHSATVPLQEITKQYSASDVKQLKQFLEKIEGNQTFQWNSSKNQQNYIRVYSLYLADSLVVNGVSQERPVPCFDATLVRNNLLSAVSVCKLNNSHWNIIE